jgi:hypothetical protein
MLEPGTVPSENIHTDLLFHILLCYSLNSKWIFLTNLHTIPHNDKVLTSCCQTEEMQLFFNHPQPAFRMIARVGNNGTTFSKLGQPSQ